MEGESVTNLQFEKEPQVGLRSATKDDERFLFEVVRTAMQPLYEADGQTFELTDEEFRRFSKKFDFKKSQIIMYGEERAGRLRVERTKNSIHLHAIHLMPEFQGKGIGAEILTGLIQEADRKKIPIELKVRGSNQQARKLYERLGFKEASNHENYFTMEYLPKM